MPTLSLTTMAGPPRRRGVSRWLMESGGMPVTWLLQRLVALPYHKVVLPAHWLLTLRLHY